MIAFCVCACARVFHLLKSIQMNLHRGLLGLSGGSYARSVASLISTSTVVVHLVTNDATAFINSHWSSGSASSLPFSPAGSDLQEPRTWTY